MVRKILYHLAIAQDALSLDEQWLRRKLKQHSLGMCHNMATVTHLEPVGRGCEHGLLPLHSQYHKRKNFIAKLIIDGRMVTNQEENTRWFMSTLRGPWALIIGGICYGRRTTDG